MENEERNNEMQKRKYTHWNKWQKNDVKRIPTSDRKVYNCSVQKCLALCLFSNALTFFACAAQNIWPKSFGYFFRLVLLCIDMYWMWNGCGFVSHLWNINQDATAKTISQFFFFFCCCWQAKILTICTQFEKCFVLTGSKLLSMCATSGPTSKPCVVNWKESVAKPTKNLFTAPFYAHHVYNNLAQRNRLALRSNAIWMKWNEFSVCVSLFSQSKETKLMLTFVENHKIATQVQNNGTLVYLFQIFFDRARKKCCFRVRHEQKNIKHTSRSVTEGERIVLCMQAN